MCLRSGHLRSDQKVLHFQCQVYFFRYHIFPEKLLTSTGFWLATIAVLQASPTGFANEGYKFYLLFICSTAAMWIFVFFFLPETSRIPMEEMGLLFGDEVAGTLGGELKHHEHANSEHVESTAS